MTRTVALASLLALCLAAAPKQAGACDPEAMDKQLTELCRAGLDPAAEVARAVLARATAEEALAIEAAIVAATRDCDVGDPLVGARRAVEIARLAGRVEARTQ